MLSRRVLAHPKLVPQSVSAFLSALLCSMAHCWSGTRPNDSITSTVDEEARRKSSSIQAPVQDPAASSSTEHRNPLGAIGNEGQASKANDVPAEALSAAVQDPLAGMSEADKWGIKGLLAMMAKYPAYSALVHGMNPAELGLDLNSDVYVLFRLAWLEWTIC